MKGATSGGSWFRPNLKQDIILILWASVMSHSSPLTVSEHLSELQSIGNIFPQVITVQGRQKPCLAVTVSVDQVHFIAGFEQVDIPSGASGKEPAFQCRRHKRRRFNSLSREDPLEEGMATYSSVFAWRIIWTEEPSGLWSIGLQRV